MTDDDMKGLRKAADCAGLSHEFAELEGEIERLRASLGAIHARVCHAPATYGMGEAIASECEHAIPELAALRAKT